MLVIEMGAMSSVLNFMLGLLGAMLIIVGLTDRTSEKRSQMILIGVGLFVLTLLIHFVMQMMDGGSKAY